MMGISELVLALVGGSTQISVFYFTFKGKVFVNFLPFQGLASLEKVKNIFYLFHQVTKKLKISEFRAKIKGKCSPAAR